MGKITVNSQSLQVGASYENEEIKLDLSWREDAASKELKNISGTVLTPDGSRHGSVSGVVRDGRMRYTLADMDADMASATLAAMREVEEFIAGKTAEEETA